MLFYVGLLFVLNFKMLYLCEVIEVVVEVFECGEVDLVVIEGFVW